MNNVIDEIIANWENVYLESYKVYPNADVAYFDVEFLIEMENGDTHSVYLDEFPEDSAAYRELKEIYDVNFEVTNLVLT